MTTIHDDDVEARVRELFDRQASAIETGERIWGDAPHATVVNLAEHRSRKRWIGGGIAAFATVGVAAAVMFAFGVNGPGTVKTEPPIGSRTNEPAVSFVTNQVSLTADNFVITANGMQFTARNVELMVHSDPGGDDYQTLEVEWTELGVEQRLYIYFASDGNDWWATEIRTRNGHADADWIEYLGSRFRTPVGSAFTGSVDLRPDDGRDGRLEIENMRLMAFKPPAVCENPTSRYALFSPYSEISSGGYTAELLDTKTCKVVTGNAYDITWTAKSGDAEFATEPCDEGAPTACSYAGVAVNKNGIAHITAKARATGEVVAVLDVPMRDFGPPPVTDNPEVVDPNLVEVP